MPQMSAMMWIVFLLVMCGFLMMVLVFFNVESKVYWAEDVVNKEIEIMKW